MSKFVTLHGFGGSGGSGSELNFEIVGGTTQPTNPTENTIWVNTDVEITSYMFSVSEPESLIDGMVWISTSNDSSCKFNVLNENGIVVCPMSAKQYINGEWVTVSCKSYIDEEWKDWGVYLFDYGFTGYAWQARGWKEVDASNQSAIAPSVTQQSDGSLLLRMTGSGKHMSGGVYELASDINLSQFKTLHSEGVGLRVCNRGASGITPGTIASTSDPNADGIQTLDLSNINGNYDIVIALIVSGSSTASCVLKRVWLTM